MLSSLERNFKEKFTNYARLHINSIYRKGFPAKRLPPESSITGNTFFDFLIDHEMCQSNCSIFS